MYDVHKQGCEEHHHRCYSGGGVVVVRHGKIGEADSGAVLEEGMRDVTCRNRTTGTMARVIFFFAPIICAPFALGAEPQICCKGHFLG